jgi:GAF domain-containing protein
MTELSAPENTTRQFSFQAWRSSFLALVLRGALIFALGLLIPTLFTDTDPIFFVFYGIAFLALLVVTFVSLPYSVKAWTFITLFFLLGIGGLLDTGIWGDARLFFIAAAISTAMLISTSTAIWVAVISLIISAIAGWFILTGQMQLATEGIWTGNLATWLSGVASILMLDAVFIGGLKLLMDGFTQAQERAAQAYTELEAVGRLLEEKVARRTQELQHKSTQLEAASYVARQVTDITDLQVLLNDIARTIADQFHLYHVGIFLMDDAQEHAVLQAASSAGGRQMLELGHRLKVGSQGIVGYVTERAEPRIALDVGTDPYFLVNRFLPETRSEMALPLISRNRVIGALDIQSEQPTAFAAPDLDIMQTLADQLATAIENSRLFGESKAVISQFEALTALQTPSAWRSYLDRRHTAYQYTRTGTRPLTTSIVNPSARILEIPLELRSQKIGVISLRRKPASPDWSPHERELASELAAQVSLALDNARLLEETTHRAEMERITAEISTQISSSTLYESILRTAAQELSRALGGSEVLVQIQPAIGVAGSGNDDGFVDGGQQA